MAEKENKMQELQILEQNFQNLMVQKQSFQIELSETQNALSELENSGEEVYKIIGQLMMKTSREKMKEELKNKERLISLRISSIEKQEDSISQRLEILRKDVFSNENGK